ncbi:hypothetical protein Microterr_16460 [Microbacterium terricola]|uniref:Aminoglycoside phosphotransferase domain-containing protein n=1 Tax=Microbacterium terricola TaxID=344163 RepID=A0ABM8DZL9_9MICO|nr:hypothetical protein Microterr_16460 [Microbacterium terricola]
MTSALPRVGVVGAGNLTESATGRYDAAVVQLDDGRRVVVRVPAAPDAASDAASDLAAEARALRALTPGVRGLLPFRAPEVLGETSLDGARAVVVDYLPGYRVDAAHLPPGEGVATSIGDALGALHSLPLSIVRTEGLPSRTPEQVRDDVRRTIDRASETHVAPISLIARWTRAVENDELWRFESAVVLGGAAAASFLLEDVDDIPQVTGALDWSGLSVGDPATDLQWLAAAPAAADDVFAAYVRRSGRAPDALLRDRARLYAELEFAKWLVHGHDADRADIVDDAAALLLSLAETTSGEDIVTDAELGVDDAIALLDRVPAAGTAAGTLADMSMQTDTYGADELSLWDEENEGRTDAAADPSDQTQPVAPLDLGSFEPQPTVPPLGVAPMETLDGPMAQRDDADSGPLEWADTQAQAENSRAADAALRRWLAR